MCSLEFSNPSSIFWYLDEVPLKKKKSRKKKSTDVEDKPSLGIIDEEELEHLQSDVDDEEDVGEGAVTSDIEDEEESGTTSEPLYVLPLYAILSTEKQARVRIIH